MARKPHPRLSPRIINGVEFACALDTPIQDGDQVLTLSSDAGSLKSIFFRIRIISGPVDSAVTPNPAVVQASFLRRGFSRTPAIGE
jgi:hypothetical protein